VRTTRERVLQGCSGDARGVPMSFLWMIAQIFCDHIDCLAKFSSVVQTNNRSLLRCAYGYQSIKYTRDVVGAGFRWLSAVPMKHVAREESPAAEKADTGHNVAIRTKHCLRFTVIPRVPLTLCCASSLLNIQARRAVRQRRNVRPNLPRFIFGKQLGRPRWPERFSPRGPQGIS
jgi:hypothetical protein